MSPANDPEFGRRKGLSTARIIARHVARAREEIGMTPERVILLEGGNNFRDLGGYPTMDGRKVKWRRLFRSGAMHGLTPDDYGRLTGLGLKAMCDFRSTAEREAGPTKWHMLARATYWSRDYDQSLGELWALLSADIATVDQARTVMAGIYRQLPFEQAPAYREVFRLLATGETPLVFNCSAGKDRTGVAAALVLKTLGVPDQVILEDYVLSNITYHYGDTSHRSDLKASPDVIQAIGGTDPDYLRAAFLAIDESHGSTENYLREALGVSDDMITRMRSDLLER